MIETFVIFPIIMSDREIENGICTSETFAYVLSPLYSRSRYVRGRTATRQSLHPEKGGSTTDQSLCQIQFA